VGDGNPENLLISSEPARSRRRLAEVLMFSHFLRKLGSLGTAAATGLTTIRTAGRRWHLAPEAAAILGPDGPDLERWLADGSAEVVKTGPHRTVYRVRLPGGMVYVKHCRSAASGRGRGKCCDRRRRGSNSRMRAPSGTVAWRQWR